MPKGSSNARPQPAACIQLSTIVIARTKTTRFRQDTYFETYVPRPGNVAKCIALGYHVGAQTYDLTWVHHDWKVLRNVNRISLD